MSDDETGLQDVGVYFRPAEAGEAGVTHRALKRMVREGQVERVARGLYRRLDVEPTENHSLAEACAQVSNSIVCLLSALQFHGIGTSLPAEVWLGIPNKAYAPTVHEIRVQFVRFSGAALTYGVVPVQFEGVEAEITNPARTVLDCFRLVRRVGHETARGALYDALDQRIVTVDSLYRAMEVLPSTLLRQTLEAMP